MMCGWGIRGGISFRGIIRSGQPRRKSFGGLIFERWGYMMCMRA